MYRTIYKDLVDWKKSKKRKPLILEGARQVGKTWIINEFGKKEYEKYVYINCDNNPLLNNLFIDYDMDRVLRALSAISNTDITPDNTLIFFDEIQELDKGLTSLKYFYEKKPEYHVVVAGSLLGIKTEGGTGFPVGKADKLRMEPLSFNEFVLASGNEQMYTLIKERNWRELSTLKNKLIDLLRQYYYVGGMPEVVSDYLDNGNLQNVRQMQKKIIKDYESDFSKHAPENELPRITMVWNSIPKHLSKENKKFIYGALKAGARAKEFEKAIIWLLDAGMIHKVNCLDKMKKPLKFYENENAFKIYLLDLGLLGAMTNASASDVLVYDNGFVEYKGALSEQYVAQQFFASSEDNLYYFSNENSTREIDFVTENSSVCLVEVKAEENLKSKILSTSLKEDSKLFGWRFSMSDYYEQNNMINIPLYLCDEWFFSKKHNDG